MFFSCCYYRVRKRCWKVHSMNTLYWSYITALAEFYCLNYAKTVCHCVLDAVHGPRMCPRHLLFLRLQWVTCGIQLFGLFGGKRGSCWRPMWHDAVLNFTPPGHIVLCTNPSSHYTFIQYKPLFFFAVCQRPKTSVRFMVLWVQLYFSRKGFNLQSS